METLPNQMEDDPIKYITIKRQQLHKVENLFIRFIRTKLDKMNTKSDQIEAFKTLRKELLEICKDPMEARFLEFFDIISWLESKIKNRSFGEILGKNQDMLWKKTSL